MDEDRIFEGIRRLSEAIGAIQPSAGPVTVP
jgi:hypothetical protein